MNKAKIPQFSTEEEFDLAWLRDIKHRLRMTLKQIEKAEKILTKKIKFVKARVSPEELEAAHEFYKGLKGGDV